MTAETSSSSLYIFNNNSRLKCVEIPILRRVPYIAFFYCFANMQVGFQSAQNSKRAVSDQEWQANEEIADCSFVLLCSLKHINYEFLN